MTPRKQWPDWLVATLTLAGIAVVLIGLSALGFIYGGSGQ